VIFHYFDCVGPAGTPETFDALKSPKVPATTFHLADGTGTWHVLRIVNIDTGAVTDFLPPAAFENANQSTVTCTIFSPTQLRLNRVTGVFEPGH
jgi:hypothetical protein